MADEHLTRSEFHYHMDLMRADINEIAQLLRAQNGRVGIAETKLAVLEDRASPARVASGVSAVVSGAIAGLGIWLSSKQ